MSSLAQTAALIGIATTAIIYGTDVFCALVLRPAAIDASPASIADLLGRVHRYGDRRMPIPGVIAILAAAVAEVASADALPRTGAALSLVALIAWLSIYLKVSAPVNRRLRTAAAHGLVPVDTRMLQNRWDSVIPTRAVLQAIALAGLVLTAVTSAQPV